MHSHNYQVAVKTLTVIFETTKITISFIQGVAVIGLTY
jgi:hypothetical protein